MARKLEMLRIYGPRDGYAHEAMQFDGTAEGLERIRLWLEDRIGGMSVRLMAGFHGSIHWGKDNDLYVRRTDWVLLRLDDHYAFAVNNRHFEDHYASRVVVKPEPSSEEPVIQHLQPGTDTKPPPAFINVGMIAHDILVALSPGAFHPNATAAGSELPAILARFAVGLAEALVDELRERGYVEKDPAN